VSSAFTAPVSIKIFRWGFDILQPALNLQELCGTRNIHPENEGNRCLEFLLQEPVDIFFFMTLSV
jgi:hypothetical protein